MPDETKEAYLLEETTRLLRVIAERQREYHDTQTRKMEALAGEIARKLFDEIDQHRASILRAKKYCDAREREQLEQEDTRVDSVMVRRDPTPAFGSTLPQTAVTAEIRVAPQAQPWYRDVLANAAWWWHVLTGAVALAVGWWAAHVR